MDAKDLETSPGNRRDAEHGQLRQDKEADSADIVQDVCKTTGFPDENLTYDTGLVAWLQVFGSFFLYFNSWGVINIFGVFQTYYERTLLSHMSPSSIAWIGSVQSALLMLIGVITGPLFDAGYFYYLVPTGVFLVTFGFMMTSLASEFYQIMLAQGICVGIGTGCLFVPSVALLPQYFKNRRALANGFAASGSSIGGVLYPIAFHRLQEKVGFPWATRVVAFISLATGLASVASMRLRFQPKEKRALIQLSHFKDIEYCLFCFALFIGFMGFYNFLVYVQPFALEKHIVDDNLGFYLLAILNGASTFGRIVPNMFADRVGPLNMLFPAVGITALIGYCWAAVHNMAGIVSLSALYGFFSGGFVSLVPVVMIVITKDLRTLGTRLGMCFGIESLGLLIGTPVGGAILKRSGSYIGLQIFTGTCLAACAVSLFAIRIIASRGKLLYKI